MGFFTILKAIRAPGRTSAHPPHRLGRRGERAAARYLRRRGLRILARNIRSGGAELDLIALEGDTLVFVEVKSRGPGSWDGGFEKVDRRKRTALRRACRAYLRACRREVLHYRLDGVSVAFREGRLGLRVGEITWVQGLFAIDG